MCFGGTTDYAARLDRQTEGTIMKIADTRTRIESGTDDQSFLATETDDLGKTPVLTLVDTAERSDACDPLIQALVSKLPKPNTIWPIGDRAMASGCANGIQPHLQARRRRRARS
jgi:hypothetical protein